MRIERTGSVHFPFRLVVVLIWRRLARCVQLAWSTGNDNPAAWADLIAKLKEGLVSAFDSAVSQREEEVRRSESQRLMPGWNFCTFFILKVRPRHITRISVEN